MEVVLHACLEATLGCTQVNVQELTTCSDPNQYATPSAKADFKVHAAEIACTSNASLLLNIKNVVQGQHVA